MLDPARSAQTARRAAAAGMVLLKNEENALPLKKGGRVALAGNPPYFRGGSGSAEVFCSYETTFAQGLAQKAREGKIMLCEKAPTVIATLARLSGEGDDLYTVPGQYFLTEEEEAFFASLQKEETVERIILILNIPTVVDLSWIDRYSKIRAVLLAWLPGMEGGNAAADLLCGDQTPSGRLTDTVALAYEDYPSSLDFQPKSYFYSYEEDVYLGYRFFETFRKDRVLYPFGFGLSYTSFSVRCASFEAGEEQVSLSFAVRNTGSFAGAEVVQVYSGSPEESLLGRPAVELRAFGKTRVLAPGEEQTLYLSFSKKALAAFDDTGETGHLGAFVWEKGDYPIYFGANVRSLTRCGAVEFPALRVAEQRSLKLSVPLPRRLNAKGVYAPCWIGDQAGEAAAPCSPPGNSRFHLRDVAEGRVSMSSFLEQMTDEELINLASAQPPAFPRGTAGIGNLKKFGVPNAQTADGPSGLRKTVPTACFPCATLLACSWDPEILYEVGKAIGQEACHYEIDVLLAPGLNLHRNPLCGRNFEYYSEDPLVSGKSAAAFVRGVQSTGTLATLKHFAANNKEAWRAVASSQVSERALRELYLKGFEIAVKEADPAFVMTGYNLLNGTHVSAHTGLLNGVLREEWGFAGAVMSDWRVPERQWREILAGNNIKMPFGYPEELALTQKMLQKGRLSRTDLLQNAAAVCRAVMRTRRFRKGDLGRTFPVSEKTVLEGTVFTGVSSTGVGEKKSPEAPDGYVLGDTGKDKHDNDTFIYYDLLIPSPGRYRLSARIATPFPSTRFDILLDETPCARGIAPLSANGWDDWHSLPLGELELPPGEHRLTLFIRDEERERGVLLHCLSLEKVFP